MKFKKGDSARESVPGAFNPNPIGTVFNLVPGVGLVGLEYDDGSSAWFDESELEEVIVTSSYGSTNNRVAFTLPPGRSVNFSNFGWDVSVDEYNSLIGPPTGYCKHDWKDDHYFTAKVFTTCTKCGAKKEEV